MNSINQNVKEDFSDLKPCATIEETKDSSPDGNAEAEYLKKELAELQGENSPFAKMLSPEDELEKVDAEEDDDGLALDFIA